MDISKTALCCVSFGETSLLAMPEVGLVHFARFALDVAGTSVPCYRTAFSNHQFTQPSCLTYNFLPPVARN